MAPILVVATCVGNRTILAACRVSLPDYGPRGLALAASEPNYVQ